ncbi:MAG: quinone-dependent dihydroorotate dehydrogenase [Bacteriovoracaceae bacterium]|nr:quinone-dependent dihydroorotate dehydrogenase [Bacteriovoracaceae bacterium]
MYPLFRSMAFKQDPEKAHENTLRLAKMLPFTSKIFGQENWDQKTYELDVAGLKWSFPIGLAAGLDKDAVGLRFFEGLGFGAIEVGTVTPKAQPGNDKPRLFRYPEESSLRNRMGFNNHGSEFLKKNIIAHPISKILGANLGKNKITAAADAPSDYQMLYKDLAPVVDYLVINVSSPNTPGLRDLQNEEMLSEILQAVGEERAKCPKPLFLKIAPDLASSDIASIVKVCVDNQLSGIVATNTTKIESLGDGGVSGQLLRQRSREVRSWVLKETKGLSDFEVIGVGGVDSYEDLREFWKLGGKVMQIYTSFIYKGPNLLQEIKNQIDDEMEQQGVQDLKSLTERLHQSH